MKRRPARAKIIAVPLETWRSSIHSTTVERRRGMTPGSWQAASAYGMWLWWPCRQSRGPTRCGARVGACRWHTDWRGQGRSIPPELHQPACLDEITWPSGRTLRTSDPWGRIRFYGQCRTGSRGALACRGGHRSRRYRRLCPRRGKIRRWAFFLVILSMRRISCNDVLCLCLNPNCSSRISPHSFTIC